MSGGVALPVAVGGIGGSGTRVIAALLAALGYYLGDDLNEAMDNLWFTLLFKRRSILVEGESDFGSLVSLFLSRMSEETQVSEGERARLFWLAEHDRLQLPRAWLIERAKSFVDAKTSRRFGQPWGWKEPNSHIVIDRVFAVHPDLRYIHVVRHPLDMAVSANQQQLQIWGPIFLNRDVVVEPGLSLSYWCAAHRRVVGFMRRWPERTLMIDFDALCLKPEVCCAQIAEFLAAGLTADVVSKFCDHVRRPEPAGRHRHVDLGRFDPGDLAYVAQIGYAC